jgi:hypothetical protein
MEGSPPSLAVSRREGGRRERVGERGGWGGEGGGRERERERERDLRETSFNHFQLIRVNVIITLCERGGGRERERERESERARVSERESVRVRVIVSIIIA